MRPKILLAGLGGTGQELLHKLCQNWEVIAVDTDPGTLEKARDSSCPEGSLRCQQGDATSAIVLRRAGLEGAHAACACTGSDEVNLEVLRLAHDELGIENRFAVMYSSDWQQRYHKEAIEVIGQDQACASILASRIQPGQHVATGVGLGRGEIVEVEVLPNSSVIGRRLADLHTKRWLVGAVYRNNELIIPHGDTVLEPGDRVLVVGDPKILPAIATLIRTGESEFPLQYGSHVVTLCETGVEQVLPETAYLLKSTRADLFEAISCQAKEKRLNALLERCGAMEIPYEFSCTARNTLESLIEETKRRDVGVLILPHEHLPLGARIGLGRSRTAQIIDLVSSPVLVSRESFPYRRILLVLAELPFHDAAAQLAIDLARMFEAELHLGVVHQPEIVTGAELRREMEQKRREVENLASLYHLKVQSDVREGNPIHEIERASADYDLLVLPYSKGRRGFLTKPDVALNLIHRAQCSVMVMPH